MKYCPITYEQIAANQQYSDRGLHLLSPQLKNLLPLAYSADEQRREAYARVGKMSVQGVQTKLSAQLKVKSERFELVDQYGHYILKPQSDIYAELPENEALTMSLAALIGIEVPVHGLVYCQDGSMTYFIKRFDRVMQRQKLAVEDFSQLLAASRDTKYDSTMEKVCGVVLNPAFCSFPKIEALKFFKLTLFNFLVGNEDMHLKNFSLITRNRVTTLSPAYDLLNTTIAQKNASEELALSLHGKKRKLTRKDFIDYLAFERLQLNERSIESVLNDIRAAKQKWYALIQKSFLSEQGKVAYRALLDERWARLALS